eukprot:99220-Alexandrium_andersonii.AAC.1
MVAISSLGSTTMGCTSVRLMAGPSGLSVRDWLSEIQSWQPAPAVWVWLAATTRKLEDSKMACWGQRPS